MSPSKRLDEETLDLDSINPYFRTYGNPRILENSPFGIKERENEKRINLLHYVIHLLAFLIVIPFIFFIAFGVDISKEYSTIVSIVIGFYFGKSLLDR